MKTLHIPFVNKSYDGMTASDFALAAIDCFPWDESGYRPKSCAGLCRNADGLAVCLSSLEAALRMEIREHNGKSYEDSCLEFFLSPAPESGKYLNFELTPTGFLRLGFGPSRRCRKPVDPVVFDSFSIKPFIEKRESLFFWRVSFFIPKPFLEDVCGRIQFNPGAVMRGNFYKCGDLTPNPHYGCWSPIDNHTPDFHLPEYFGQLVL